MAIHNISQARHLIAQTAIDDAQDTASAAKDVGGAEALAMSAVTNCTSVIVGVCHFKRVDDIVIVSGRVTVDPTLAAAVEFGIDFPTSHAIANVAAATEVHGHYIDANGDVGLIEGDTTNERATVNFTAAADTSRVGYFMYSFEAD